VVDPDKRRLLRVVSNWSIGKAVLAQAVRCIYGTQPRTFLVETRCVLPYVFSVAQVLGVTEPINRAVVALLAAWVIVLAGVLIQRGAVHGVGFNTLGLRTGMMPIVVITRKFGVLPDLTMWSAKTADADP
jgi:hypothetical protein